MTSLAMLAAALPAAGPFAPEVAEPALSGVGATIATVAAAALILLGAVWVLLSAVAMHRVNDALSRVNALGPATGVGIPWIVIGAWLHNLTVHAFSWVDVVKVLLTLGALLLVSSVASNALSRAAVMSGAQIDPSTSPNDLLEKPDSPR